MERNELVVAVVIAIIAMIIGFLVYSFFFRPLTAEVRPRFKGSK